MLTNVQIFILKRLKRFTAIGKHHILIEKAIRGIPSHKRGDAKKAIYELVRIGYLIEYPTKHGIAIKINPRMLKEINASIGKYELLFS